MDHQAETNTKDTSIDHRPHTNGQAYYKHDQTEPLSWRAKLDALLQDIQLKANKIDISKPDSSGRANRQHHGEHHPSQPSDQKTPHLSRFLHRRALTLKTVQARRPPCQIQQVSGVRQSMRGRIEHGHATPSSQMRDTVSLTGVHDEPGVIPSKRARLAPAPATSISRTSTLMSSASTKITRTSSSKLSLSQRLLTMDVRETIVCLREYGYTTTFIAEHLSVRDYKTRGGKGKKARHSRYHEQWVQEFLDGIDK